jgi:hypothetical protein
MVQDVLMRAHERVLALTRQQAAGLAVEREARHAAALVAAFVGIPAAVAAGTTIVLSALTAAVLLAPLVAVVLSWVAWRYGRADRPTTTPPPA